MEQDATPAQHDSTMQTFRNSKCLYWKKSFFQPCLPIYAILIYSQLENNILRDMQFCPANFVKSGNMY